MRKVAKQVRVGRQELTSMATILVATHAFLIYPATASRTGLEAAWLEPLLSGCLGLVVFLMIDTVFRRYFPGQDLLEVVTRTFGNWIGKVIAIAFAGYFIWITASIMRQFGETVIITVLPNTPLIVIISLFAVTICYVASCGLEAIVRLAQIALPIVVIGIVSVVLLTLNWWQPVMLLPFWGNGIPSLFLGSLESVSNFVNVLLLCLIYPHAKDYRDLRRIGVLSTVWGMLLITVFLLGYHMVFSAEGASKLVSPIYSMARLIHIGRFLQRVESVYIFIWVSAAIIKMSITLWAAAYVLLVTFNWESYRPILPALGLSCLAVGMMQPDIATIIRTQEMVRMSWGWVVVFAAPLLIVCLGAMRTKWRRPSRA